ncbi:GldG family protein [bacterium]|nr:GldG family protein [bacterium]
MATNHTDSMLRKIFMVIPILGLVCLAVSIGIAIHDNQFTLVTYIGMAVGVLLFLTLFVKAEVANLKYYLNVFVYSALVFGICVVGYLFARQYKHQIDLTKQNLYSLDAKSKNFLHGLGKDVQIVFFTANPELFRDVEEMYGNESSHLKFKFINPIREVAEATTMAAKLGITKPTPNELVLKCGDKTKRMSVGELLQGNYENAMTNAILEVTAQGNTRIYFTTGHGELPLDAKTPTRRGEEPGPSLGMFKQLITPRGMECASLDLLAKGAVPDDATAVVIAAPTGDFSAPEIASLRAYLEKGGRLLVAIGPSIEQQRSEPYTRLAGLLGEYGIALPDDIILDMLAAQLGNAAKPIVGDMDPNHPITKDLVNTRYRATLTLARPVETTSVKDNRIQATELIRSSEQSFLWPTSEALKGERPTAPKESQLKAEPIGVAVSMEPPQVPGVDKIKSPKTFRLVVYGSGDLVYGALQNQLFARLMVNSMSWLTQREEALDIAPRCLPGTPIILDLGQQKVMFVFAVLLLPGLLFFGGVSYSLLRRRK